MTPEELQSLNGEKLANFVLIRRLFVEPARMRDANFLADQQKLALKELGELKLSDMPGVRFHPAAIEAASDIIQETLSKVTITGAPSR